MTNSKVVIKADELGNKIRVSKNNPEFGFVVIQSNSITIGTNNWLKGGTRSTLINGTVEQLQAAGFNNMTSMPGKLVIREQVTPFTSNEENQAKDLKMAGDTGVICRAVDKTTGEEVPIYRKTIYDPSGQLEDTLVPHINSNEIREANGIESTSESTSTRRNKKKEVEVESEEVEETQEVELENADEEDSFEL